MAHVPASAPDAFRPTPDGLERLAGLLRLAFDEAELPLGSYLDWFAHLARLSRRGDGVAVPVMPDAG
jgi:hypothetical protein